MAFALPLCAVVVLVAGRADAAKVNICHVPPGNPSNFHTITVNDTAVTSHLAHGDFVGPCESNCVLQAGLCDDENRCTSDVCKPDGTCQHSAVDCSDGNDCTADSCDPQDGCLNTGILDRPCEDGDACTRGDACTSEGACAGAQVEDCCHNAAECGDGNLCTDDSCVENSCQHTPVVCSDTTCTVGSCDPNDGMCLSAPIVCEDDGNVCTEEACTEGSGCASSPLTGSTCNDQDECTTDDACVSGECAGTQLARGLNAAAITKQITGIDSNSVTVEILTLTNRPFQLMAQSLDFTTDFLLSSIGSSCLVDAANHYRCRHTIVLVSDGACQADGDYTLHLAYSCSPAVDCDLCAGNESVGFSLTSENFCEGGPIDGGTEP